MVNLLMNLFTCVRLQRALRMTAKNIAFCIVILLSKTPDSIVKEVWNDFFNAFARSGPFSFQYFCPEYQQEQKMFVTGEEDYDFIEKGSQLMPDAHVMRKKGGYKRGLAILCYWLQNDSHEYLQCLRRVV